MSRSVEVCTPIAFRRAPIAMPTEAPMSLAFFVLAGVTLAGAVCAMSLRNLVHCGLCLALTFAGLAAIYLQLSAEFVGLAQILVYVGAVAPLIVFSLRTPTAPAAQ